MLLGLLHTESAGIERLKNFRRSVFYNYPNGSAPLIALLSMLKEESTNDPEFSIYEKRLAEQRSTTAAANANGPFTTTGGDVDKTVAGFAIVANDTARVKVADSTQFRVGHVIQISTVPNGAATATQNLKGIVTSIVSGVTTKIEVRWIEAYTSVSNDTDANSLEVMVIGNAASEAQVGAALAPYTVPLNIANYTQIFRTPFQFSGTVLKTGLKYDRTGPYKDKAKDATLQHAMEMEKGFLFGVKQLYIDATSGLPTRLTGGVEWFLRQWEAGTVYGNTAATLDTDDNKRIIENSAGSMNLATYNKYMERLFRVTSNQAQEKLVLCGTGFLARVNDLFVGRAVLELNMEAKQKFGWDVVSHLTPFGMVHYKTAPLFSQNASLRNCGLFLDVWNLVYRYMDGRDTTLLKLRQPNNADYREDEWLGECGLELRFPESHLFIKNFQTVVP
jgi:hypothetical protein